MSDTDPWATVPDESARKVKDKEKETGSTTKIRRAGPENRGHHRFRIEDARTELYLKGFLTTIGIKGKNEARVAVNLSEGGVMVSTLNKLAKGTKVVIRIEMEKFKDVIEAEGVVRWCYASARNASEFYSGVQFLKLPPADLAKIVQMRAWFTSPEFRKKSATRRRNAEVESPPDTFELM